MRDAVLSAIAINAIWIVAFLRSRARWMRLLRAGMDALRDDEAVMKDCPRCQRLVAQRTKKWLLTHTELKTR